MQTRGEVVDVIVNVIQRLEQEMAEHSKETPEYMQRFMALGRIWDKVREDFGEEFTVQAFYRVNAKIGGHSVIPGWLAKRVEVTKVHSGLRR